jgi:hypothetical protein
MTRRRDLMCEDLFGCIHRPEVAISRDGEIVEWRCRCGKYSRPVASSAEPADSSSPDKEGGNGS